MKKATAKTNISRRHFLGTAAAAIVLPAIVPSSIFGQNRPSNRINLGVVGWGMQGPSNTKAFLVQDTCRVVAACDLDKNHLADAVNTINGIKMLRSTSMENVGIVIVTECAE